MGFLCMTCDRSPIENESEHQYYRATLRKKNDKSLYKKHTIKNINLDEYDKRLHDYITTPNKIFDVCSVNCNYKIEIDKNFVKNIGTGYVLNIESEKTKIYSLYSIVCLKLKGYKFCKINQMAFNTIIDKSNITYENYMNKPMSLCERNKNLNFAKNPQLISSSVRNENHHSIRKYSHIPFKN